MSILYLTFNNNSFLFYNSNKQTNNENYAYKTR